jgi:hypothetical protein
MQGSHARENDTERQIATRAQNPRLLERLLAFGTSRGADCHRIRRIPSRLRLTQDSMAPSPLASRAFRHLAGLRTYG